MLFNLTVVELYTLHSNNNTPSYGKKLKKITVLSLLNFFLEPKTILNAIPEAKDQGWKGGIWSQGHLETMASHKLQKAA